MVPLLVAEPTSERLGALYREDREVVTWWATPVECASAIARGEREGALGGRQASEAYGRLDGLAPSWIRVLPSDEIQELARRLLRVHPLRSADALQLAAAVIAAERRPPTLTVVTLDDRLAAAAEREGFRLSPV